MWALPCATIPVFLGDAGTLGTSITTTLCSYGVIVCWFLTISVSPVSESTDPLFLLTDINYDRQPVLVLPTGNVTIPIQITFSVVSIYICVLKQKAIVL